MSINERIHVSAQQLLPLGLCTQLVYWLTRQKRPTWLKNLAIKAFVRAFDVDLREADATDVETYQCFNDFFVRSLKHTARSIAQDRGVTASPVDGAVSELGSLESGRLLQAKGMHYSVSELLTGISGTNSAFDSGAFATLYLSPRDYHRIHMPCAGTLRRMAYYPGKLFSVSPGTVRAIPRLFARNERLACSFDSELGPMALVLVGAVNVAAIETVWAGLVTPPRGGDPRYTDHPPAAEEGAISLSRGEEMGRFNMGSTVILLLAREDFEWDKGLATGSPVRLGQALGSIRPARN